MKCSHIHPASHHATPGKSCGRNVAPGFTVCNLHGGNLPAAKAAAEKALALSRMPAITALNAIIEQFNDETCVACGYPSGDPDAQRPVIRASEAVLNRTGFGPHSITEVRQHDGWMDIKHLTDDEREALLPLLAQLKALKERIRLRVQPAPSTPNSVMPDDPSQSNVTH